MFDIYFFSFLFLIGGLFHFIKPKIYLRIMPLFIPYRLFFIYFTGFIEILSGIFLFFEKTRMIGVYAIFSLLTIFLIVHINMLRGHKFAAGIPKWILIIRLILQFVLMYWIINL